MIGQAAVQEVVVRCSYLLADLIWTTWSEVDLFNDNIKWKQRDLGACSCPLGFETYILSHLLSLQVFAHFEYHSPGIGPFSYLFTVTCQWGSFCSLCISMPGFLWDNEMLLITFLANINRSQKDWQVQDYSLQQFTRQIFKEQQILPKWLLKNANAPRFASQLNSHKLCRCMPVSLTYLTFAPTVGGVRVTRCRFVIAMFEKLMRYMLVQRPSDKSLLNVICWTLSDRLLRPHFWLLLLPDLDLDSCNVYLPFSVHFNLSLNLCRCMFNMDSALCFLCFHLNWY